MNDQQKEEKKEWIAYNTCNFCIGSRLHSCTGYDCSVATKKAEEYFDQQKDREGKK